MSHGGGGVSDLGLVIILLFVLFLVWFAAGGRTHESAKQGPFIKPYTESPQSY